MTYRLSHQDYWEARAEYYDIRDYFGRKLVETYLERNSIKPNSILDAGCGKGELFKLWANCEYVSGLDFSSNMLEFAKRRVERHGWKNIHLIQANLTKWKPDRKYDLAFTRTVLMHIHPQDIGKALDNITDASDTSLFLEYYEDFPQEISPHCYWHNYFAEMDLRGFNCVDAYERTDIKQVLFLFKRKTN